MQLLSKQEEMFLLAIFRIKDGAYLVNIREHLIRHAGKDWAFGSVYISLEKLRKKGYVRIRVGEPSAARGGKAIKYYELTEEGIRILLETKRLQDAMWKEFNEFSLGLKSA